MSLPRRPLFPGGLMPVTVSNEKLIQELIQLKKGGCGPCSLRRLHAAMACQRRAAVTYRGGGQLCAAAAACVLLQTMACCYSEPEFQHSRRATAHGC